MQSNIERSRQTQILKALGHPIRFQIVEALLKGETCVNDIRDLFDVTQPNISQHLIVLRYAGIANFRQDRNLRCYFLNNPEKVKQLIKVIREFVAH